jgi:hypothetical protein
MKQFDFGQSSLQQNFVPALWSDEDRRLIQYHFMEQESRAHGGAVEVRTSTHLHRDRIMQMNCARVAGTISKFRILAV